MPRNLPLKVKRVVIKIGTRILTGQNNRLNKTRIKNLTAQIASLVNRGIEVLLVTSGAIGAGMGMLNLRLRPRVLVQQQAAAAVGQSQLMRIYNSFFKAQGLLTAQVLLTRDDLSERKRYLNVKSTLLTLLGYKVIPIINENDTVSADEIKFGDNDRLSALVANLVHADLLIILSDVDGLYAGAHREVIPHVAEITPAIEKLAAKTTKTGLGTGGMASKIEAAKICAVSGLNCIVANGKTADILNKILQGQQVGTLFAPKSSQLAAKKRWIGFSTKVNGHIYVDQGAKQALVLKNKSLLPKGVMRIKGNFKAGDAVSISDAKNREFARGLVNYSAQEIGQIKGQGTDQIKAILGYKDYDEVVHRDNLVIL